MSHLNREPWGQPNGSQPVFNAPAAVMWTIAFLAAVHFGLGLAGNNWRIWSLYVFAFIPARFGADPFPYIEGSQYWSFLTYAFLHADWMHLMFNSLWLLIFGTVVARYMGNRRYLLLSALSAIAGAAVTLAVHWGQPYIMVGASGAVSGLMGAAVPIMYGSGKMTTIRLAGDPRLSRHLPWNQLLHNRNALIFTGVWLLITLFSGATGFTGNSFMGEGAIAWEAHIGGFIGGLIAFYLLTSREVHS